MKRLIFQDEKGLTGFPVSPLFLVPPRRFERLTYGLGIRCSILLSYGGFIFFKNL